MNGRCKAINPRFSGGLASGVTEMNSANYRLFGVVGPVESVGEGSASSESYRSEFGTLTIMGAE